MNRTLLSLVVIYLFIGLVQGTSDADPVKISVKKKKYSNSNDSKICDVKSSRFGCDPQFWIKGNRLACANLTQIMPWVTKPVASPCFELLAGDDESKPVNSYTPGELLMLHLRVKCYRYTFRGLLIYAIDETGKKVGDWEVSVDEPVLFKRPWQSADHQCYGSLMHSSADNKPYHSILYFKAPAAGTGNITFQALIKVGNANTGRNSQS